MASQPDVGGRRLVRRSFEEAKVEARQAERPEEKVRTVRRSVKANDRDRPSLAVAEGKGG
jgi:hypothetical protein